MGENENLYPLDLTGQHLDVLLEMGYYRMHQNMFTTNDFYDSETERPYDCFWLRTKLDIVQPVQRHKIYKQNKRFQFEIKPADYNQEIDELYERYRSFMTFDAHPSVSHFLLGSEKMVEFNSLMIEVRDGGRLIAAAYFDKGAEVIMGNLNFYDPEYKKWSLGKWMMLLKIEYAQKLNFKYYYTGYIALENTKFDYKTFPNPEAVEVLIRDNEINWLPFHSLGKEGLKELGGFWSKQELDQSKI